MRNDQGVLHTVPIPKAMAYRPLLDDVAEDDMCSVQPNRTSRPSEVARPVARGRLVDPQREPGRLRLVALRHDPRCRAGRRPAGLGQRDVHPRRPWCAKNEAYAGLVREAFRAGRSPFDFPSEDYGAAWPNRFAGSDLTDIGRRGLGLPVA